MFDDLHCGNFDEVQVGTSDLSFPFSIEPVILKDDGVELLLKGPVLKKCSTIH